MARPATLPTKQIDAVVVGAGPAGLATSRELTERGVRHLVLERGAEPGHNWANLYDSLTLHTGKHMSALPGLKIGSRAPMFVPRQQFVDYLRRYKLIFQLPVHTDCDVTSIARTGDRWTLTTSQGVITAKSVVVATGIISNPLIPNIPGRERFGGRVMHSIEYKRPAEFVGRRVLVVGVGNSGGEIGSELSRAGAKVTMAVRSGANVVPREMFGLPIQYLSYYVRKLPRKLQEMVAAAVGKLSEIRRGPPVLPRPAHSPLDAIPLIGFSLVDEIRAGRVTVRPALVSLTETGARFADGSEAAFDDVILATGFRPAVGPLGGAVTTDAKGFAVRADRVTSADQPGLFFVGHNYDALGGLKNICVDAPIAADAVARATATQP
jgi:cation diffusion facilitator CzcD-associated flavoprotein CzcO